MSSGLADDGGDLTEQDDWNAHVRDSRWLDVGLRGGYPRVTSLHMRTDDFVVKQTNVLARELYALRGYEVAEDYRFDRARHPHEVEAWEGACSAQLRLTDTDPKEALANLGE